MYEEREREREVGITCLCDVSRKQDKTYDTKTANFKKCGKVSTF
jgi:hypothetical protein